MTDQSVHSEQSGAGRRDDFDERVDKCLAMVLHHAEMQEVAAMVKRVHLDIVERAVECAQKP